MTGSLSQTRGRPEPGRELDALIAEKVMGWTDVLVRNEYRFPCGDSCGWTWAEVGDLTGRHSAIAHLGGGLCVEVVPRYSTDVAVAFTVVEQLGGIVTLKRLGNQEWHATIGASGEWWAPTLPLAICRAALAALSPADDGGAR